MFKKNYDCYFKFESNWNLCSEKDKQLKIFDKLTSNKEKSSKERLNISKAANKHIKDEDNAMRADK